MISSNVYESQWLIHKKQCIIERYLDELKIDSKKKYTDIYLAAA